MSVDKKRPIRVLQVIGGTGCGGAETWLMHVLQSCDRREVAMDFLVHDAKPGYFDDVIRAANSKLLVCRSPRNPWAYARNLNRLLTQERRYDIVHSHVSYFTGLVLRVANKAGVGVRIAHAHHAPAAEFVQSRFAGEAVQRWQRGRLQAATRQLYVALMRRWISRNATHRLAASEPAIRALASSQRDDRWLTMSCGVDLSGLDGCADDSSARKQFGFSSSDFVVGHVGRFVAVKNHAFLLEVFAALCRRHSAYRLLLIGDGELRRELELHAESLGVSDRVVFAGLRRDAPRLVEKCMDAFVFPSHREGLGLALVEGQAAGIPCFASSAIPADAVVCAELVRRLSLDDSAEDWATAIDAARISPARRSRAAALAAVRASHFNVMDSSRRLQDFYRKALGHQQAAQVLDPCRVGLAVS